MSNLIVFSLTLILSVLLPLSGAFAQNNAIDTFQNISQAIVTVRAQTLTSASEQTTKAALDPSSGRIITLQGQRLHYKEKTGAGILVSADGMIATNTHIIFGSQRVIITLKDGQELAADVLHVSPHHDLSLLKARSSVPLFYAELANSQQARLGDDVITIGHSELLQDTLSGGKITGLGTRTTAQGNVIDLLRLNINHYSGDSGGPVFTASGELLGILSSKRVHAQREAFAVPSNKIREALLLLK